MIIYHRYFLEIVSDFEVLVRLIATPISFVTSLILGNYTIRNSATNSFVLIVIP